MNLKNISDEELQAEINRRYEGQSKMVQASNLLRKYAVSKQSSAGKQMTTYQAEAACAVIRTALNIDADHLLDAMIKYHDTVSEAPPNESYY